MAASSLTADKAIDRERRLGVSSNGFAMCIFESWSDRNNGKAKKKYRAERSGEKRQRARGMYKKKDGALWSA